LGAWKGTLVKLEVVHDRLPTVDTRSVEGGEEAEAEAAGDYYSPSHDGNWSRQAGVGHSLGTSQQYAGDGQSPLIEEARQLEQIDERPGEEAHTDGAVTAAAAAAAAQ
jgi:hypothetical protein